MITLAEVSVIVPVYNISKYLPRFFDSILNQSFRDFELLIFNDGSTDNTYDVCKKYESTDSRIHVFNLEHGGVTKTRSIALNNISGSFVVFADGDDYIEPDYILHLVTAQKKHNADMVISRVAYHTEGSEHVDWVFKSRGETVIEKENFPILLPALLDDRRLNYLYAKIYRSELLKEIHIEDNVSQGSDTMINSDYVLKAKKIVLIDDIDYHYIKYSSRSITSYKGKDAYARICRINEYVYSVMNNNGYLTEQMLSVIDSRLLQSAIWIIEKLLSSNETFEEKAAQITDILNSEQYLTSYKRQMKNLKDFSFDVIPPQNGKKYLKSVLQKKKALKRRAKILSVCPAFAVNAYHKLKGNE